MSAALRLMLMIVVTAADAEGFDGCVVSSERLDGWRVSCERYVADVVDILKRTDSDAYDEGVMASLQAVAGGPLGRQTIALALPDGAWKVTRFDTGERSTGQRMVGLVASGTRAEGRRVISCIGGAVAESRCRRTLHVLASKAWREPAPGSLPRDVRIAKIGGREYAVPRGCEVSTDRGASTVTCNGEPVFLWVQRPNDVGTIETAMIEKLRRQGSRELVRQCSIDGVRTTCRIFQPESGGYEAAYVARATVRGDPVFVSCLTKDSRKALPSACSRVLEVEGGEK
jgi:hypothetical protein